ncbi:DUF6233 domain-containing protein [Streptomyces boluensis]|uniref:Uncharacterized protein n=1 Tax=Streptomyces boluensis TaxID=1775135 RepID=A0A964UMJ7_9ACTN|nr:DUF6233 domain-containing protein [Streptomyces boluensis]NBE51989.1 hypothetical protein [Streptomyces boluensis]
MFTSPEERVAHLRTVEAWLEHQLNLTRTNRLNLEAQIDHDRKRRQRAHAELRWKIQPARAAEGQAMLHRGGCHLWRQEFGYLDRAEVEVALSDEHLGEIEFCDVCNPLAALGPGYR